MGALAAKHEMKPKACSELLESLAALATTEVKKTGIFTIPGLARIKTRVKPATKAGIRNIFGKDVKVKAKGRQDRCEGLRSFRLQEPDLRRNPASTLLAPQRLAR